MTKRLGVILSLVLLACVPAAAYAADAKHVTLLPFTVHAGGHLDQMKDQIPAQIAKNFQTEGIATQGPESMAARSQKAAADPAAARAAGRETGADFVMYGSFSMIGSRFSIDAKILDVTGAVPDKILYVEGDGMETLMAKVSDLSKEAAAAVLGRVKVARVAVEGNKRIEMDAILRTIKTRPGDVFSPDGFTADIRAVFGMGYFDDVRVEEKDVPGGKLVTFIVTERPSVHSVELKGYHALEKDDLTPLVDITRGSIVNIFRIEEDIKKIKDLYREKNYYNARVTHEIVPYKENEADITFNIEEGDKVRIKTIKFEGNKAYSDGKLKDIMKTSEKGFFSFVTSSGSLNPEDMNQDAARLGAFYSNNGYADAQVSEPQVDIQGKWAYLLYKIKEGPQYKVGDVQISGDLIAPKEEMEKNLSIKKQKFYSQEAVRADMLALTDKYMDKGYAYVEVVPRKDADPDKLVVNLNYTIKKNQQVYFEKIIITGNSLTRDKVIRRELPVYEKGLYSGSLLKRGVQNITRNDYYEDVKVDTVKGSADDKMILKLGVVEKPTGSFTFGGGYSNSDSFFVTASVAQRNLFGRGQTLDLKGTVGGSTTRYSIGFTEPWLFDTHVSFGVDLYDWERDYDSYDKNSKGIRLRFGYPVWDHTRVYFSYGWDTTHVSDVTSDAPDSIQDMEGETVTSYVTTSLVYDSRDHIFNPTKGSNHSVAVQYAGGPLQGDVAFTKYTAETGWYFPFYLNTVWFFHAEGGYIQKNAGGILPVYDKFYIGGINSLRGFTWEDLCPTDSSGAYIGGDKFVQGNVEYHFPIVPKAGLIGLVFYDTGDNYSEDQTIDLGHLRQSWGFGVRWFSPIGPIRLERGYILDPKEGEDSNGRWEFTMGAAF